MVEVKLRGANTWMGNHHLHPFTLYKADEKAVIRNQYNQIQIPSPDTIQERNTKNQEGIK